MSILGKWFWDKNRTPSELKKNNPKKTIFFHIPKAAGSSFNCFLENLHGTNQSSIEGDYYNDKILLNPNFFFISSHMFFEDVKTKLGNDPVLLTFLREPLDRALSHFYFLKLDSVLKEFIANKLKYNSKSFKIGIDLISKIRSMDLVEFLNREKDLVNFSISNLQTRILGGTRKGYENLDQVNIKDLQRAKKNLEKFFFIGLVERMEESQEEFCRLCDLPKISLGRINSNPERNKLLNEPPEAIDYLRSVNRLDIELYEFAKELFQSQKKKKSASIFARPLASNYTLDQPILGEGWHGREKIGSTWIVWSGPGRTSWLELSTKVTQEGIITCHIRFVMHDSILKGLKLLINQHPIDFTVLAFKDRIALRARIPAEIMNEANGNVRIGFVTPEPLSPKDLNPKGLDKRKMGFALESIHLEKARIWK